MNTNLSFRSKSETSAKRTFFSSILVYIFLIAGSFSGLSQTFITCADGDFNDTVCYTDSSADVFSFQGDEAFPLRFTINSGTVENGSDELIVIDTDGVTNINAGTPYGDNGDLAGLTFTATGNSITFLIQADGSNSCDSGAQTLLDFTVSCLACSNPEATFAVVENCAIAPEYTVDVDVTSLGSATTLSLTDGTDIQTTMTTGIVTFGPYASGLETSITITNADDGDCSISSEVLSSVCPAQVICANPPVTGTYCYENNEFVVIDFQGDSAFPVRITFTDGTVENNFDELIVFDSDGVTNLNPTTPYGAGGDISGLSFTATGNTISFGVDGDVSSSCGSGGQTQISYEVICLQCTNPEITFTQVEDCAVSPEYTIDVDVTSLGTATSLTITDGTAPQIVTATGLITFGPYATDLVVVLTATNDDDSNCSVTSQEFEGTCPIPVACAGPVVTGNYCYENSVAEFVEFQGDSAFPLRITFPTGTVENNFDELIVLDSDGVTNLNAANPYGATGDISGLTFTASGNTISFAIDADISSSCGSGAQTQITYEVFCLECINPTVTFAKIEDCDVSLDYTIDVDITDLGSGSSLTVTDGTTPQTVTAPGLISFGPYLSNQEIAITVTNDDDGDCSITSELFEGSCATGIICADGTVSGSYCYENNETDFVEFQGDGAFPLRITFLGGTVGGQFDGDELIVLDSDGTTNLVAAADNNGDITGLTYTSTGNTISFAVQANGFGSCGSGAQTEITYEIFCLECINPTVDYTLNVDCEVSSDFTVDVDVQDLGSGASLTISDNFGNNQNVSATGVVTFGPYADTSDVIITTVNDDDANCTLTSPVQTNFCLEQVGCFNVNAGEDVELDCGVECVDLMADFQEISPRTSSSYIIELSTDSFCSPIPLDGGTPTGLDIDDTWSQVLNLGFTFNYFGADYDQVVIGPNGQISFDLSLANGFNDWNSDPTDIMPIQNQAFPLNTIFGAYHDMDPGVDGDPNAINFYIAGTAPLRQFVVNFDAVNHFGCNELETSQQIILYEGFNIISVNIFDKPVCDTWNDGLASLGLQGTDLTQFSIPTDRNTGAWAAQNEFWNFIPDGEATTTTVFEWLDPSGAVIGTDPLINVCPTEPSTYTARLTVTDNADGTSIEITDDVTVTPSADFTVNIEEEEVELCDVDSYDITAELDGADPADATFLWSNGETTQTITVTDTGVYSVVVNVNGCELGDSISITFRESPIFELGDDIITCFENVIILDATPSNFDISEVTFEWSQDGILLAGEEGPTLEIVEYGTYSVVSSFEGCSAEDSISITARDAFVISVDEDFKACPGETIILTSVTEETDVTFQWFLNDEAIDGENGPNLELVIAEDAMGTQTYKVTITLGICTGEAEVDIDPYEVANCIIGQGLSPNGDGMNDSLDLEFLSDRVGGISQVQIFNRLGTLVFDKSNYINEFVGIDKNGNELPTGTYFYVIDLASEDPMYGMQATGWIYLNKESN